MKRIALIALIVVLVLTACGENTGHIGAEDEYLNVYDYGAVGDGVTDDSAAIQLALDTAFEMNLGQVYIPAGIYRLGSGLRVRMGIRVFGDKPEAGGAWGAPRETGSGKSDGDTVSGADLLSPRLLTGTWILVDHGAGDMNSAPSFRLEGNCSVSDLGFVYADMAPVTDRLTEYPPAVGIRGTAEDPFTRDGMAVDGLLLLNAYIGVSVVTGNGVIGDAQTGEVGPATSLGRLRINGLRGSVLYRGIYLKGILDTVDIRDIGFGYNNGDYFTAGRAERCADLEITRADGINISGFRSYGAKYGVLTAPGFTNGSSSLRLTDAQLTDGYPLYLTAGGQYEVSECELIAETPAGTDYKETQYGIYIRQDASSVHQPFYAFSSVTVKKQAGTDDFIPLYIGATRADAPANFVFTGLRVSGWDESGKNPAVLFSQSSESDSGGALFYDCTFEGSTTGRLCGVTTAASGAIRFNYCTIPSGIYDINATDTIIMQPKGGQ